MMHIDAAVIEPSVIRVGVEISLATVKVSIVKSANASTGHICSTNIS